jgi:hypothetical protein
MSTTRVEQLNAFTSASARRSRGAVVAGGVAGLAGGGAMAGALVIAALAVDAPALVAFHAIGDVVPGLEDGSAAATIAGILAHAAVSAALGVVFAGLTPRDFSPACTAGVGVGYALLVMGLSIGLLLPESFVRELHEIGGSWVIAHAVYGAALGLALQPHAPPQASPAQG